MIDQPGSALNDAANERDDPYVVELKASMRRFRTQQRLCIASMALGVVSAACCAVSLILNHVGR